MRDKTFEDVPVVAPRGRNIQAGTQLLVRRIIGPGWRVEEVHANNGGRLFVSAGFFVDVPSTVANQTEMVDAIREQLIEERDNLVLRLPDPSADALALCEEAANVVKMWAELGMAMPPKLAYAVKQWTESK